MNTTIPGMKTMFPIGVVLVTLVTGYAQGFGQPVPAPDVSPQQPGASAPPASGGSYAAGLLSEEGENDLAAAAAAYRQTIQAFDRQRDEAANAIFRLGEVYRKIGQLEEAKVQYARILREFPDMIRLTELSHNLLFGDGPKPGRSGGLGGGGLGGGGGVVGLGAGVSADTDTASTPDPADPGYYERPIMQRYGIVPGRIGLSPQAGSPKGSEVAGEEAKRIACVSNLKQLGLAARIYAADNQDAYPPEVKLMSNEIAVTKVLVCLSDTKRQPASSWDEFDPHVHMTYEYHGASARDDEPQRVLFKCPIHGHVALGDGSVQHGRIEQPAVTPRVNDLLRRRYGAGGMTGLMRERYGLGAAVSQSERGAADTLNTILNNLRQIDGAKQQWALETRKPQSAQPTEDEVARYMRDGLPKPVAGERYEVNALDQLPAAALTWPIGLHQAGNKITVETEAQSDPLAVAPITIAGDGTVRLADEQYDLDQFTTKLRQLPAVLRTVPIVIHADKEVELHRIVEVLDACSATGVNRVTIGSDAAPTVAQEVERLNAEANRIQRELVANSQAFSRITSERAELESEMRQAKAQQSRSRQKLEALSFAAELLPTIVSLDERYQRLKAEYETAVLNGHEPELVRTRARLKLWVERIYHPELLAEVELADNHVARVESGSEELDYRMQALRAQETEKRGQLNDLGQRIGQLQSLLDKTQEGQRPEDR